MVSVIIPAYNAEKTVGRTIESVQNQSVQNYEIIVINDGSTDSTQEICEGYVRNDCRINLVNKENGGVSSARNAGLRYAKGEFIAFLDADDEYMPDFLAKMISAMLESQSDVVVCGYYSIFSNGEQICSDTFSNTRILDKNAAIKELIIGKRLSSHAWNKLYKKNVLCKTVYPEGHVYEDMYVMPDIIDNCSNICFLPDRLVKYYQYGNSITHCFSLKKEYDAFIAAHRRYLLYKDDYSESFSFLVREPAEIALRLYTKKKKTIEDKQMFLIIEESVRAFIEEIYKNRASYRCLRIKYKFLLRYYKFMKGKIL